MTAILACTPDLMDRSKVSAAAAAADRDIRFVGPGALATALADAEGLVLVDLSRPGVIDTIAAHVSSPSQTIIGFGSHVDRDALDAALAAGCDQVLARSAFFARLPALVG